MSAEPKIYYLSSQDIEDDKILFGHIYQDTTHNYYWSDNWSKEFYTKLAYAGFISVSYDTADGLVLLPEIQFEYALLDFGNLHVSKKVKKLMAKGGYRFSINERFEEILQKLESYHDNNWIKGKYALLLEELFENAGDNFRLICAELTCQESGELIAGEIGYIIGRTYTSLSGSKNTTAGERSSLYCWHSTLKKRALPFGIWGIHRWNTKRGSVPKYTAGKSS